MTEYTNLPDFINLPLDEKKIKGDKEEFWEYFKSFVLSVKRNLEEFSAAFNVKPEYYEGNTKPDAADGQFLIWKDTDSGLYYVLYGDGGSTHVINPVSSTTVLGLAQRATDDEAAAGENTTKYVTPYHLHNKGPEIPDAEPPLGNPSSNGQVLSSTTSGQRSWISIPEPYWNFPTVWLEDRKSNGTNGGSASAGWQTRALTNEVHDPMNICSLSSNRFTLPTGKYLVIARAPAYKVNNHRIAIYDYSGGSYVLYGANAYSGSGDTVQTDAHLNGFLYVTSQKTYELRHYCNTARSTDGLGIADGQSYEVYSQVILVKIE